MSRDSLESLGMSVTSIFFDGQQPRVSRPKPLSHRSRQALDRASRGYAISGNTLVVKLVCGSY
jgi:hypothetical protein